MFFLILFARTKQAINKLNGKKGCTHDFLTANIVELYPAKAFFITGIPIVLKTSLCFDLSSNTPLNLKSYELFELFTMTSSDLGI